jgi:hypothetical protein
MQPNIFCAQGHLRSIGLPSARIFNGGLMESIPWLVLLDKTSKFHITKGSDKGVSWTATADAAGEFSSPISLSID